MSQINHQHPEYKKQLYFWDIVEDVLSDDERNLYKYLRYINPADKSDQNKAINEAYQKAAAWYGFTSQTLNSLVGSIFKKWPTINVPPLLEYLKENADGSGSSIYQLSQAACRDGLSKGRGGLYVGFPAVEGQVSQADLTNGTIKASLHYIPPENIINWRIQNGLLSLVVITEKIETADGYATEEELIYRELFLEDGIYQERLWKENGSTFEITDHFTPTNAAGKVWNNIPFTFIGSSVNDEGCDKPPIWPLAVMNLKHYQNSADNEESVFLGIQNQPYLNTTDITPELFQQMREEGVYFGNRELFPFPVGIATSPENTQVSKEMQNKVSAMEALGARLATVNHAAKTATQVDRENEGQTSVLAMVASNVSEAFTKSLFWVNAYMNIQEEGELAYTLNQDFINLGYDFNMLQVILRGFETGAIPAADYVRFMKRMEVFDDDKPVEEYLELLADLNYG